MKVFLLTRVALVITDETPSEESHYEGWQGNRLLGESTQIPMSKAYREERHPRWAASTCDKLTGFSNSTTPKDSNLEDPATGTLGRWVFRDSRHVLDKAHLVKISRFLTLERKKIQTTTGIHSVIEKKKKRAN